MALALDTGPADAPVRVLVVAEHASARFGGEAALSLHYFRVLLNRRVPVWLITHARVRAELLETFPEAADHMHFIEDAALHRLMWRMGRALPARLAYFTTGYISRLSTQFAQRRLARKLVQTHGITVVHQPMPVSPKEPSLLHGLGAPVVIGPMNGGMDYPPGFEKASLRLVSTLESAGRMASLLLNRLIPGKRRAAMLLVANERTRRALPPGVNKRVLELQENGVDLQLWRDVSGIGAPQVPNPARFVFMGRLIDLKGVDMLLEALSVARRTADLTLTVIGDGPDGPRLRQIAADLGLLASKNGAAPAVTFAGWKTQRECAQLLQAHDALALPSLRECGGAVVLEAMACGLPVLATAWGGPLDYLDSSCGILVPPHSRAQLVCDLADGLARLAGDPALRRQMGQAGRKRVEAYFDWDKKTEQMMDIYRAAAAATH